jgi:hypothetical protein
MTSPTLHIDMTFGDVLLDTFGREILDTYGRNILDLGWVDVRGDVLTDTPTNIFQGQKNGDAVDRVADPGTIKLVMNNNDTNSGGVMGYYSPDSGNKRPRFDTGLRVRIGLEKDDIIEWLSLGRVINIKPVPGLLNNKLVDVICGDWIEVASRTPIPRIPVQENIEDDGLIQTLLDELDDAPLETDLDVGAYTYTYGLTDVQDEETRVLSVLQTIAQCGLGRIFITGGVTSGEILRYVNLYSLLSVVDPVATFVNAFIDMEAERKANRRVKRVVATGYPMATDASPVVLYTLINEISIPAGEQIEFIGTFRDPNDSSARTIAAVNVVTPVINTDYKFSSISGSGTDLNASLEILDWDVGARSFKIILKNNAVSTGYLWFFQPRGEGLYPYDAITYTAIDTTIKESEGITVNLDLPYHADYYTLKEIAEAVLGWYSTEATSVPFIDFVPTASDEDYEKFIASKPGEVISATESVTGISQNMVVIGREIGIWNNGVHVTERLYLMPVQQVENALYFTLDTLNQDDLDGDNAIIAFG